MILLTHKMIAEQVYERVTGLKSRKLDRDAFIRGNLLPDISSRYRKRSHYSASCWDLLESLAVDMDGLLCRTERGSEGMGVICHFISDFFCTVHNAPFAEKMPLVNHLYYEHRLHGVFRQMLRNGTLYGKEGDEGKKTPYVSGRHWVAEGLITSHSVYTQGVPSMENDIRHALEACTTYCRMMLELESRQLSIYNLEITA